MRKLALALLAVLASACSSSDGGTTGGGSSGGGTGGGGSSGGGGGATANVSVDPNSRFQTITGWESTASVDERSGDLTIAQATAYSRAAVEEVGLTRLRLEVRNGVEGPPGGYAAYSAGGSESAWDSRRYTVTNDNADPNVINAAGFDFAELDHNVEFVVLPMRNILAARGESLYLNICYVAFVDGRVGVHESAAEYAEFALATMLHLRQKYGIEPDAWEVILEPDLAGRWSGQRVGQAIVATAQRFDQNAIRAKFIAPSTTNMATASVYFDGIASVSGAVARMSEFSYHRYAGVSQSALDAITTRARNNGLAPSMLEYWFGLSTPDVLFEDLAADATSFQGRVISGNFIGTPGGTLTLNEDVRFNSAVYRAVRPGAVRIGATSTAPNMRALAFQRPDGKIVVALRATAAGSATIGGLSAGDYLVTAVTSTGQSGPAVVAREANGNLAVSIGAAGVIVAAPR